MGCKWYDPASYGNCAGQVAKSVAGDAFHSIAESFGAAADHAVNWLWSQVNAATAVHLGGPGFDLELGIVTTITAVVALGLFLIQIIQSVLRREPGGLGRALKGLCVAFLGGGAAIAVVNLMLAATDALSEGVVQAATGTDIAGLGRLILGSGAIAASVGGSAGLLLLSLAAIAAVVIVYIALVIRKVLIVLTAVFAPLAFAGSLADITVAWTKRWIETTVALIVSKLILVLIFITGYGILVEGVGQAGSGLTQRFTQVVSGVLVLALAGLAPWCALKVVHFTGEHAHQLHSLGASSIGGVAAGRSMAQKARPHVGRVARMVAATATGGAGAAAASAAGAGGQSGGGASSALRPPGSQGPPTPPQSGSPTATLPPNAGRAAAGPMSTPDNLPAPGAPTRSAAGRSAPTPPETRPTPPPVKRAP